LKSTEFLTTANGFEAPRKKEAMREE